MTLTPSAVATTTLDQMHSALLGILEKGIAHAKAKGIDQSVIVGWRLSPDMFALARQVQIACDIPVRGLARLAGADLPSFPDTEQTLEDLRQRVVKAQTFLKALDASKIDADPQVEITFPVGPETMTMTRSSYLLNFILPNLYFHVTAAYAILRACGVPLGKADFLARPR